MSGRPTLRGCLVAVLVGIVLAGIAAEGVLRIAMPQWREFHSGWFIRKTKPGGIVMVGLYNRYARVATRIRSHLIGVLGPKIDYVVRTRIHDPRKAKIWIKDQYHNPHET